MDEPAAPAPAGGLRGLLDRQVALIEAGDLDGLLGQYHDDAELLRFDMVVRGRDELRAFFAGYLALEPRLERLDAYAETSDLLSYQATMATRNGLLRTYGVMLVRDGRIARQAAGVFPSPSPV